MVLVFKGKDEEMNGEPQMYRIKWNLAEWLGNVNDAGLLFLFFRKMPHASH